MSIFTNQIEKTLPVPNDPDHAITIRKLPRRHLEKAAREAQRQHLEGLQEIGGPRQIAELQEALEKLDPPKPEQPVSDEPKRDPLTAYDRQTLLQAAIVRWTYDVPVTPETIQEIDEDTEEWLAREVLRLSRPSLFETEADRKNG